jgi:predicted nucleic acid-binding protein
MVAAELRLLPVEPAHFHRAAELVLDLASALRAGDALHLACAEAAGAKQMATLDDVLARSAQRLKIKPVALRAAP